MNDPPNRWMRAGQAIAIGRGLAILIFLSLVWSIASRPFDRLHQEGQATVTNQTAVQGLDYTAYIFDSFLTIAVVVSVLGTIAYAVYQRSGGV